MLKGTSNNILCDNCRTIITNTDFITIKGKKGVLHFCNNDQCYSLDKRIEDLGYKKLSNITWAEHCLKCKSHPIFGCAMKMPNSNEFFDSIVFQKKINIDKEENLIIEVARPKKIEKTKKNRYCDYSVGVIYVPKSNPKTVVRLFFESIDTNKNAIDFIKKCEIDILRYVNFIYRETELN